MDMLTSEIGENMDLVMPLIYDQLVEESKFNPLSPRLITHTFDDIVALATKNA